VSDKRTEREIRKVGKQVTFVAGPYAGQNGRSLGPVGTHEVRVWAFRASREVTVDSSDLDVDES
jgi:hypothetical protein